MLARLAPTARRTVRGPAAHAVSAISRQAASTAGGASVTVTGTGFVSSAVVVFGGTDASTAFVNDTTLTATVPAHAEGVINIGVRQYGATQWLTDGIPGGAFEYLPAPTVTYISHDFEDGLVSPFGVSVNPTGGGNAIVAEDGPAISGTKAAKGTYVGGGAGSSGNIRMVHTYSPSQPALQPNGVFQRWYLRTDAATITAVRSGQIKLLLNRGDGPTWIELLIGAEGGSGSMNPTPARLIVFRDFDSQRVPGQANGLFDYWMQDGVWVEIQTHYLRSGGVGRARVWLNGRLYIDHTHASFGTDDTAKVMRWHFMGNHTQNTAAGETLTLWVDDAKAANGWIEAT